MAIIDNKRNSITEDEEQSAEVYALEETGNVEKENLEYSPTVAYVTKAYNRAKDARYQDEERWLMAYRNYRGIYGPDVQFTSTEKSKAFVKITKTKVLAAYSQITEVLFSGGKFPIGVEASLKPKTIEDAISIEAKPSEEGEAPKKRSATASRKEFEILGKVGEELEKNQDKVQTGPGQTPTSATFEPAKEAAYLMEQQMHDQLEEAEADKHLRAICFEMALLGTGVMKGPFAIDKEYPKWSEDGDYDPHFETIPSVTYTSVWNSYPDPDATNMAEAEFFIERHKLSKAALRGLKRRPHFRNESIELAIEMGDNYTPEHWEHDLADYRPEHDINRYEVLEYWGYIDAETAKNAELKVPEELEDKDQLQVNIWVCNNQILRLVLNPFTPARIPYLAVPYEMNPYSFFGIGIGENMEDTQLLMNGFMRMAVDNAALSGNVIFEVDENNLSPGQNWDLYPGKMFRRNGGAPGQAIFSHKINNITNELFQAFDKARQLADESTGMPSYSHGQTGVTGGFLM